MGVVINYREGGYKAGGGQKSSFTPNKKGAGVVKVSAMLKRGGGTTSFEIVLTWELDVLARLWVEGWVQKFPPFKGWGGGGGCAKSVILS